MQIKNTDWKSPGKPTTTSKKCLVPFSQSILIGVCACRSCLMIFPSLTSVDALIADHGEPHSPRWKTATTPDHVASLSGTSRQRNAKNLHTHSDHLTISCTACLDDFVKTALSKKSTKSTAEFSCLLAPISFSFAITIYLSCFGSYLSIHIIQRCKRRSGDSSSAVLLTAKCNSTVSRLHSFNRLWKEYVCIYIYYVHRSHSIPSVSLQWL